MEEDKIHSEIKVQSKHIAESIYKFQHFQLSEPEVGLYYVNDHVKSLLVQTNVLQNEHNKVDKELRGSLLDIKKTVKETEGVANLKNEFSDKMMENLMKLLNN